MASALPPLAQSESKARFMERLGLDMNNPEHKRIYSVMKDEAARSRESMMDNRDILLLQLRNDASIQPPYSNAQITETATHREILRLYRNASETTKPFYELGHDRSGIEENNWVIRWLIWHVFRYRDARNRNRRSSLSQSTFPVDCSTNRSLDPRPSNRTNDSPASKGRYPHTTRSLPYDPTRDD